MNYDLERFIVAHERDYATALEEIKNGKKETHWMWYIFPQIAGLGGLSETSRFYEIKDLGEAKAYMANEYLRNHLIEISGALLECEGDNPVEILGFPDNLKLLSSMTLFDLVAPEVREFSKVLWNMCMYDTYYTSIRTEESEGSRKMWLQELPADYSIIDAQAYMGYLYSFDVSYFISPGSNIDAYAPKFKKVFRQALEWSKNNANYQPNYPNRHGRWVYWTPLLPDEAWVFKYHDQFAGSIPPLLGMMIDCAKMEKYKALEDAKAELEVYKVIVATVPRLTNNRGGNRTDNFAISAEQVREFVDMVKKIKGDAYEVCEEFQGKHRAHPDLFHPERSGLPEEGRRRPHPGPSGRGAEGIGRAARRLQSDEREVGRGEECHREGQQAPRGH